MHVFGIPLCVTYLAEVTGAATALEGPNLSGLRDERQAD